ncbi:hypothetical protein MMC30_001004, partial [Trapelia coarctata]|nr:hypothetical protein [Trapelia coarctata]
NQVRPFKIQTPDGEALYAWHILPIAVYAKSDADLILDPTGSDIDVTKTTAFRLLRDDPESRLVISFHGNAGTVCQGWRTDTYRALSAGAAHKIHVLTVDYRGFGYSTGSPSEEGLITDGITLVDWALQVAGIPPERIVIVGQSLGTAVAAAVVEHYTEQSHVKFAGVVLVAAFSKIPELMLTYAAGSIVPILSPLRIFPKLQRYIAHRAKDTWNTEARLTNIIRQKGDFNLVLVHAINDYDIRWTHSNTLFYAAANATSEIGLNNDQIDNIKHHTDLGRHGWTNKWPATTRQNGVKTIRQIILRDG